MLYHEVSKDTKGTKKSNGDVRVQAHSLCRFVYFESSWLLFR